MRNQYIKKQLTGWLEALIQQYINVLSRNPTINYITLEKNLSIQHILNTFKMRNKKTTTLL